ncbi:MAG: hypothetical protein KDA81_14715 [Planctomycetaceae bacterium]|nr:hypothetical protein [Planctomycetaceae bacterium]
MKCEHCRSEKYLRISQSKDRWYFRLFLMRCLRCRYCGHTFLSAIWHPVPTSQRTADSTPATEVIERRAA